MTLRMLNVVNGLMMVLFAVAAIVQYNDADPGLWMTAYGAAAVCCAFFLIGRCPRWVAALLSGVYALGVLYLLAQVLGARGFMDPTGQEMLGVTEPGREMMGILLAAGWTGVLASQKPTTDSGKTEH